MYSLRCCVAISSKFRPSLLEGGGGEPSRPKKLRKWRRPRSYETDKLTLRSHEQLLGRRGLLGRAACDLGRGLQGAAPMSCFHIGVGFSVMRPPLSHSRSVSDHGFVSTSNKLTRAPRWNWVGFFLPFLFVTLLGAQTDVC